MRCADFQIKQKTDYYDFCSLLIALWQHLQFVFGHICNFQKLFLIKKYSHLSRYSEDEDWAQDRLDLYCR